MAEFTRTWWGRRFLAALEGFTDAGRLGRGRAYARGGKIVKYEIIDGMVRARVRGSINPYFGVYKEPIYTTTIRLTPIEGATWSKVVDYIGSRANLVTRLLLREMPDTIDDAFAELGLHLLPRSDGDFSTECSCPDWVTPCKHIAGVYYLLAADLDEDPFLLFELRGLSRQALQEGLSRSPLGAILAGALEQPEEPAEPVPSYFTVPTRVPAPATVDLREFWMGARRLPAADAPATGSGVPALLIKKQGDYPPFWHKDTSFIGAMEELYERVRAKSPQLK